MSKEEFLKNLRKKLSILEESEIDDIIEEYNGYIEEKIVGGSTEEEAVSSMGNIDELARDLLSAYKIKSPNEKTKDTFNNIIDGGIHVFERIIDTFAHKSFQEIIRFIFELVFIFLLIAICKLPFEMIESLGRSAFYSLGGGAFRVLAHIWEFIIEFVYLVFAVLFFIKIFESRYLSEFEEIHKERKKNTENEEVVVEKIKKKKPMPEEKEKSKKREQKEIHTFGVIDSLVELCMLFLRMIAFFILIGVVCYVIGMSITVGLSFYCMIKGIFYFGIYLILFSLFILGIIAFIYLFNFVFHHKTKKGVLLILSIICFVLLGIGVGVCAIEFASTTIVYNEESEKNTTETYTYTMHDNLVLRHKENIKIDNSLNNQIKAEYRYNNAYYEINPKTYIYQEKEYDVLYFSYEIKNFIYNKNHLDHFLNNLKHKKIYLFRENVTTTLFMSQKTYDKLMENEKKFAQIEDNDYSYENNYVNTIEDLCDELYDLGHHVPHHCYKYGHYGM